MTNDHDRIRRGIEFMTAYVTGNALVQPYAADLRREDPHAMEAVADGTAALCALLLRKQAVDQGKSEVELLQELARAVGRHEGKSGQ